MRYKLINIFYVVTLHWLSVFAIDICNICICDQSTFTAVCSNVSIFDFNLSDNVKNLVVSSKSELISVPWYKVSNINRLEILNLTTSKLDCNCHNAWLAYLDDFYNKSAINVNYIPHDVEHFYDDENNDFKFANIQKHIAINFVQLQTISSIFNLPKIIHSSENIFDHCLNTPGNIRQYFESKCGIRHIVLTPLHVLTPLFNESLKAECSFDTNNGNYSTEYTNSGCVKLQYISSNVSRLNVNHECSRTSSYNNGASDSLSVNNLHFGYLFCTANNSFLPKAILKPVFVMGPPSITFQTKLIQHYTKLSYIFSIDSYPKAVFELINVDNADLVQNFMGRKKLKIEENVPFNSNGRKISVVIVFDDASMNCINGKYVFKACNKYGCDSYMFEVDRGMPTGMCVQKQVNNSMPSENNLDALTTLISPISPTHENWIYLVVPFVVVFAVIIFGILATCFFLRMFNWSREKFLSTRLNRARASLADWEMSPLSTHPRNLNPNETYVNWLDSIKSRVPVYPPEQLTVLKELGEGAFGRVYLAEYLTNSEEKRNDEHIKTQNCYTNLLSTHDKDFFAMKVLKNVTGEKLEDLEREMKIMSALNHPNIVKFYGISFKCGTLALLFECMENGDLVNYLRNNSIENNQCLLPLSCNDLLTISCQIARGLDYLASQHLVHRDLAARNCLVGDKTLVKISDFGMTRDIYITDYYKMGAHTLVPLRWLPPESILYRKFTSESDVWSFGVLLWEIFTYGKVPWYMYSNCEVLQIIQDGKLLEQPSTCPGEIYSLMVGCWARIPNERLTANQLLTKLELILENKLRYCNLLDSEQESLLSKNS